MGTYARPALAEGLGTLLFVFLGAGSAVAGLHLSGGALTPATHLAIASAHGLGIALAVSATAGLSGGHLNPAVTFALLVARQIPPAQALAYGLAQLVGAGVGAFLVRLAMPPDWQVALGATTLGPGVGVGSGLLMEAIMTFILVFVVFGVAVDRRGPSAIAPLAIGLAVLADALVGIPLTGASMNPARSFGPALVAGVWQDHWVYWVGPLTGGALAGLAYRGAFLRSP